MKKLFTFIVLMGMGLQANAFTSKKIVEMTAEVTILPPAAPPVLIRHAPLKRISLVTKNAVVQGESGARPNPRANIDFPSRITPETQPGNFPTDIDLIRITVRYRHENIDGTFGPIQTLPTVFGPDPIPFAFQIPPDDVDVGVLQYQIIAERVRSVNGVPTVVRTDTYPKVTGPGIEPWYSVDVRAQAADVISTPGGRVKIDDGNPNDGEVFVDAPEGAFSDKTSVNLVELPLNSPIVPGLAALTQPLALYQLTTEQPFRGFLKGGMLYPDFQFPTGQDGVIDGTSVPEKSAAVVFWDGFMWRRLGALSDPNMNLLTVRIEPGMEFFAVVSMAPMSATDRRPMEKVFSPNGDGINDDILFSFDLGQNAKVEIFDMTGRRVRSISSDTTQRWDGRDDSGHLVESGVYIYQYTADGERVSGVIAVAK